MDKNKNELQLIGYLKQNSASLIALLHIKAQRRWAQQQAELVKR